MISLLLCGYLAWSFWNVHSLDDPWNRKPEITAITASRVYATGTDSDFYTSKNCQTGNIPQKYQNIFCCYNNRGLLSKDLDSLSVSKNKMYIFNYFLKPEQHMNLYDLRRFSNHKSTRLYLSRAEKEGLL